MSERNKIKFGLKNFYWAPITRDTDGRPTYGTPVHEPGATEMTAEANVETLNVAADDNPAYATATDNKGYNITLTLQVLSDEFKVQALGWKRDNNGVLVEPADAVPAEIAVMMEFSGDKHATRHAFYYCTPTKPAINSRTKGESLETQTDAVTLTAAPDPYSGYIHASLDASSGDANYTSWFTEVYEPQFTSED